MTEVRVPDPTLMARLQLSVKGVDWAASLVQPWQHERIGDGWSAHQHLWHLLSAERHILRPRIEQILAEDRPQLPPGHGDARMERDYTQDRDIAELAEEFMAERAKTVEILKGVTPDQWQRTGIWPDGTEVDLAWLAEHTLWHALDHFAALLSLHGDFDHLQSRRWLGQG